MVSFSVNSRSGFPWQTSQKSPRSWWLACTSRPPRVLAPVLAVPGLGTARSSGRRSSRPQAQVLRNQRVGNRCSGAGSGPRLVAADPDQEVVRCDLGVLDLDVEVAIVGENAGVDQLVLRLLPAASPVLRDEIGIGKRPLRIFVESPQVGVGGRGVEVPVVLLDVLAVVALAAGQAEQPLLQNRVGAVPEGQGEAEPLLLVGDAQKAVFAPAVGAGASLIMREVIPGGAEFRVVLADGAPLPLREVGPPAPPLRRDRLAKHGRRNQRLHRVTPQLSSASDWIGRSDRAHDRRRRGAAGANLTAQQLFEPASPNRSWPQRR